MKNSNIREKDVEKYLKRKVTSWLGGKAYKYTSPARRSVPDDILLWIPIGTSRGRLVFVECKAPGKKLTDLQALEAGRLMGLGQLVFMVDTYEAVDDLLIVLGWMYL